MTAAPIKIKTALREIIVTLSIVPTTVLTAGPSAGATSVAITPLLDGVGRSRILPGGRLGFHDDTGELLIPIDAVSSDGGTVTLKTALIHDHDTDTKVYSNLLDYSPEMGAIGRMLVLDDPVISMVIGKKRSSQDGTQNAIYPTYEVEIDYVRRFSKPADDPREADIYSRDQENACLEDTTAIEKALLAEQTLVSAFHEAPAVKLGAVNSANDLIVTTWDYRPIEGNVWEFFVRMELRITGLPPHIA